MSTEAAILIKNQVPQYIKGASDATIRGRLFLRILKEQGRIKYNHSGDRVIWNVLAREPQARTHSSGVGVTYAQFDAYEQLSLPVAGMTNQDALELKTQMLNKDPGVIVDLYGTKLDNLLRATANSLSRQVFLTNGGDNNKVVGLASPMIADGSVTADDMVAVPSSSATYGGKSVQLGNLGGTWTSTMSAATRPSTVTLNDWPYGSGSSQYDYITPKMLNASSSRWTKGSTGSNDWASNCEYMIRRANTFTRSTGGDQTIPTMHMLSAIFFDELRDSFQSRERIQISDYARGLGFDNVLNYDGALIHHDFDCPANKGYAFNPDAAEIELRSASDQLFFTAGPKFDMEDLANQFLVGFFGQMKFNPKHVCEYGYYGS